MLDIRYITLHPDHVIQQLNRRGATNSQETIQDLLSKNNERKRLQQVTDELLSQIKKNTTHIAHLLQQSNKPKAETYKTTVKKLKSEAKTLLDKLHNLEQDIKQTLLSLPNIPHPKVPQGTTYQENVVVDKWTSPNKPPESPQPHWNLLTTYNLANFQQGNKITGAGFPVYHDQGARLQRALVNFFIDQALAKGYKEIQPPLIVNRQAALGTGQLPDKENIMYTLQEKEELYLIPTAEVPVTNIYSKMILQESQLPIQHVAYTPCFRREAGSWGFDTRGLKRLHQFDKVELVIIDTPEHAMTALNDMLKHITDLLKQLGLTYRILNLCTGELGFASALTYDVEVWATGQQEWLEVSSVSLFQTFQSLRMQLRYKKQGKKHPCYTLNGSALALPRIIAALLENYQTADSIHMPSVLHPYLRFQSIHKPT